MAVATISGGGPVERVTVAGCIAVASDAARVHDRVVLDLETHFITISAAAFAGLETITKQCLRIAQLGSLPQALDCGPP